MAIDGESWGSCGLEIRTHGIRDSSTEMTSTTAPAAPGPATAPLARPPVRLLDPIDRTSEILFGLIMVLTFTSAISVAEADHKDIRTILIAAIGCNLAWGLVDAVMYIITAMTERRRGLVALRGVRGANDATV